MAHSVPARRLGYLPRQDWRRADFDEGIEPFACQGVERIRESIRFAPASGAHDAHGLREIQRACEPFGGKLANAPSSARIRLDPPRSPDRAQPDLHREEN